MLQCFFPQNVAQQIQTPLFLVNAAYDSWQVSSCLTFRCIRISSLLSRKLFYIWIHYIWRRSGPLKSLIFGYTLFLKFSDKEHFGSWCCWSSWNLAQLQAWYIEMLVRSTPNYARLRLLSPVLFLHSLGVHR